MKRNNHGNHKNKESRQLLMEPFLGAVWRRRAKSNLPETSDEQGTRQPNAKSQPKRSAGRTQIKLRTSDEPGHRLPSEVEYRSIGSRHDGVLQVAILEEISGLCIFEMQVDQNRRHCDYAEA